MLVKNISRRDFDDGDFSLNPSDTIVINITDPNLNHSSNSSLFAASFYFKFADVQNNGLLRYKDAIAERDAQLIADAIILAQKNKLNILAVCDHGISRSGAVVQAAIGCGFGWVDNKKYPNQYVLNKIRKFL